MLPLAPFSRFLPYVFHPVVSAFVRSSRVKQRRNVFQRIEIARGQSVIRVVYNDPGETALFDRNSEGGREREPRVSGVGEKLITNRESSPHQGSSGTTERLFRGREGEMKT